MGGTENRQRLAGPMIGRTDCNGEMVRESRMGDMPLGKEIQVVIGNPEDTAIFDLPATIHARRNRSLVTNPVVLWFGCLWFGCLCVLTGCSGGDGPVDPGAPLSTEPGGADGAAAVRVTVASYPLYESLKMAAGEKLALHYPEVPDGEVMSRGEVAKVQASKLILLDGTHHVGWVDTVSLPETKKRLTTFDVMDRLIMVDSLGSHAHGPGGEHSHPGIVAQTWLDPQLFREQIRTALRSCKTAGLLSENEAEAALETWWNQVQSLDNQMAELAEKPKRNAIANGAGTEYLARRLGWTVEIQDLRQALASDPGRLKTELRQRLEQTPGLVVFLTSEDSGLQGLLSELSLPFVVLDLIDNPADEGYLTRLENNLVKLGALPAFEH